jgi:hypothetical protein
MGDGRWRDTSDTKVVIFSHNPYHIWSPKVSTAKRKVLLFGTA